MASQPVLNKPNETSYMGASQSIPLMPDAANSLETDSPQHGTHYKSIQTKPTQVESSLEDKIPKVGMKFCTEEEAYHFYNAYAGDRKKNKNDPMASGCATEANTRRTKKGKNYTKAYGPAVGVDNVTYEQPHYPDLGHFGTSMYQNQIQIPGYYLGYYPHRNAFVPPHFSSFFGTPNDGQDTQANATQSFNTNPYNVFANFK